MKNLLAFVLCAGLVTAHLFIVVLLNYVVAWITFRL